MYTIEEIKSKLIKYLPSFIDETSVDLLDILYSIASVIVDFYNKLVILKDCYWTGTGLRLTATENRIFYNKIDDDTAIQNRLIGRYDTLTQRGSETNIELDLKAIYEDDNAEVNFYDKTEAGFIFGTTVFGDNKAIIGVDKLVEFKSSKIARYGSAIYGVSIWGGADSIRDFINDEIIRKYIIPFDVEIIYG